MYHTPELQSAQKFPQSEKPFSSQYSPGRSLLRSVSGKTVFGFLPWWEYSRGSANNLRYDLLSHIAVAFFEADGEGNIKNPPLWPWADLVNKARINNVKLIMSVANFDSTQINKLLNVSSSRQKIFNGILDKIKIYGFDGVNIDFENLTLADRGTPVNTFMKDLSGFIKLSYPSSEISFASPAVNSGGWNFSELANSCDYLFIMGYDFYGSWSTATGPSSPFTGYFFNISNSINIDYNSVQGDKLILGVPYYGNYWRTDSKEPYAAVVPFDSNRTGNNWVKPALPYKDIISGYASKEKMWDDVTKSRWLRWQDTKWNQIWYDDQVSLTYKYDFATAKNLRGIGIWALGYDDGRKELWDLIEGKFPTNIEDAFSNIPVDFKLYQNYPNPFNPETVINYQIPFSGHVTLKIFDLLGREIATLVDKYHQSGTYYSKFSTLPAGQAGGSMAPYYKLNSGVYIYTLRSGQFSSSKKMILLK